MLCERCGSERVNFERDATLVATALRLEGETLVLDSAPVAQGLDGAHLCCLDCGQEQHGVEWKEERPQHAPAVDMVIDAEDALDRIVAHINEPGECNGGDLVEFVSQILPRTGRLIVDWDG